MYGFMENIIEQIGFENFKKFLENISVIKKVIEQKKLENEEE